MSSMDNVISESNKKAAQTVTIYCVVMFLFLLGSSKSLVKLSMMVDTI